MKIYKFARRWWLVGAGTVLGISVGLILSAVTPKAFTATTTFFLASPASADSSGAYNGDLFSQQRSATYSQLVGTHDLALKVIDDLGLTMTPDELTSKINAAQVPKTVLLALTVTDSSAQRAANIARTYGDNFPQYVARLETPVGSNEPVSAVTVIQKAEVPTSPTSPNTPLNGAVGLAGGAFLGFFLTWFTRLHDHRIRTTKHVEDATGATVLGVLPRDRARLTTRLDLAADSTSTYAESIRRLRTNLLFVGVDAPPRTIAFVAPASTMSTTATATNLAVALDGISRQVALIDADLHESRLGRYIGVAADLGLASAVSGAAALADVIVRVPDTGVDLLPAGSPPESPGEVLASDAMAKVIAELGNSHDFVFCDTPGLLTATDAAVIGLACDGVILVATQGKTRIEGLSETAETLRRLGTNVLGAVLTDVR